ncbi:MAG: hypothetical protein NVSMB51_11170 [Solirubrobacteraceae bacterium]
MRSRGNRHTFAAMAAGLILLPALAGCSLKRNANVDLVAGKKLFVAKCGSCHVLGRAGTKGNTGPNLDDAFRNSLRVGLQRNTVRGVVNQQILYPEIGGVMPAKLVQGQQARDVAGYVAAVASRGGQDNGLLATAVQSAGAGTPAVEAGGSLEIDADPSGQLAYVTNKASGTAGSITLKMANKSGTPHNIALQQGTGGPVLGAGPVLSSGISSLTATVQPGTYTYFCQVAGHRQAGMLGTLTIK